MISSLVVTGCYTIGQNSSGKIEVEGQIYTASKDIPFIRYRFDNYGEAEYNYIVNMKKQFPASTHLAEIPLNLETPRVMGEIVSKVGPIARYVYTQVDDENVNTRTLSEDALNIISNLVASNLIPDRLVLKDKSDSLDAVAFKKFQVLLKGYGIKEDRVGLCSSPLSFGDLACLTAVRARELMTAYGPVVDGPLPSANHQCMNCCGCIRYVVINNNIPAPADTKVKVEKVKKEGAEKEKKEKPKKVVKVAPGPGAFYY